jgi:hypothetical protein
VIERGLPDRKIAYYCLSKKERVTVDTYYGDVEDSILEAIFCSLEIYPCRISTVSYYRTVRSRWDIPGFFYR